MQNSFFSITAPFKTGLNVEETISVNIIIMVSWACGSLYRNGMTEFIRENHMSYLDWKIQTAYFLTEIQIKYPPQKSVKSSCIGSGKTISLSNTFSSFSSVFFLIPFEFREFCLCKDMYMRFYMLWVFLCERCTSETFTERNKKPPACISASKTKVIPLLSIFPCGFSL